MKKTAFFLLTIIFILLSFSSCKPNESISEKDEKKETNGHSVSVEEAIPQEETLLKSKYDFQFLSNITDIFKNKKSSSVTEFIPEKNYKNIQDIMVSKYVHTKNEENRPYVCKISLDKVKINGEYALTTEVYFEKVSFNKIINENLQADQYMILRGYSYDATIEYLNQLKEKNHTVGFSIEKMSGWGDYGYITLGFFTS